MEVFVFNVNKKQIVPKIQSTSSSTEIQNTDCTKIFQSCQFLLAGELKNLTFVIIILDLYPHLLLPVAAGSYLSIIDYSCDKSSIATSSETAKRRCHYKRFGTRAISIVGADIVSVGGTCRSNYSIIPQSQKNRSLVDDLLKITLTSE